MSIQEAPSAGVNSPETPGTPEGAAPGAGPGEETTENEGTDQGSEPGSDGGGEESSSSTDRREQEPDPRDAELAELRRLVDRLDASPYAPKLAAWLQGKDTAAPDEQNDPIEELAAEFWPKRVRVKNDDGSESEQENRWHDAMVKFGRRVADEALRQAEARFEDRFRTVDRALVGSRHERALEKNGISREQQEAPEFRKFMARLREERPDIRNMTPEGAAEFQALKWAARTSTRERNHADRQRLANANGAKLNGSSPRGGATSKTQFRSLNDYIAAREKGYTGLGR